MLLIKMNMTKIKYILLLLVNTVISTAIYYFLLNVLFFYPAMAIYQILAIIAVCGYILLVFKFRNDLSKASLENSKQVKNLADKRQKTLKIYMVFAFPFLFTVLIDYIYLIVFIDNPMLTSIIKTLK